MTPFTYLIGWTKHDRWYYGVRFARNCHSGDLWTSYFTSSKHVKAFREEHGEPDVVEVRQTFNDSLQAREWEHKVLRRLNVMGNDRWLNKGTGKAIPLMRGSDHWAYGVGFSEHHCKALKKPKLTSVNMKGPKSDAHRIALQKKHAKSQKVISAHQVLTDQLKNSIWITDGNETKRVQKDSLIPNGWRRGRHQNGHEGGPASQKQKDHLKLIRQNQIMQKGWFWITDGINNQRCFGVIPDNFKKGMTRGK